MKLLTPTNPCKICSRRDMQRAPKQEYISDLTAKPSNTVNDFTKCPKLMPNPLTAVTLQGEFLSFKGALLLLKVKLRGL